MLKRLRFLTQPGMCSFYQIKLTYENLTVKDAVFSQNILNFSLGMAINDR